MGKIRNVVRRIGRGFDRHSNAILTVTSVTGVFTTIIFCIRDTCRAALVIDQLKEERGDEELSRMEIVMAVAPVYAPTIVSGGMTIVMILINGRCNAKKSAVMASLYSGSQAAMQEYQNKVIDKIGEKKEREVRDAVAEQKIADHPVSEASEIATGHGQQLCYDEWSDRYFLCDVETLKSVMNKLNHEIITQMSWVTMNDFYREIGLPPIKFGNKVGFNVDHLMELYFTSSLADDGRPCLVVQYYREPIHLGSDRW